MSKIYLIISNNTLFSFFDTNLKLKKINSNIKILKFNNFLYNLNVKKINYNNLKNLYKNIINYYSKNIDIINKNIYLLKGFNIDLLKYNVNLYNFLLNKKILYKLNAKLIFEFSFINNINIYKDINIIINNINIIKNFNKDINIYGVIINILFIDNNKIYNYIKNIFNKFNIFLISYNKIFYNIKYLEILKNKQYLFKNNTDYNIKNNLIFNKVILINNINDYINVKSYINNNSLLIINYDNIYDYINNLVNKIKCYNNILIIFFNYYKKYKNNIYFKIFLNVNIYFTYLNLNIFIKKIFKFNIINILNKFNLKNNFKNFINKNSNYLFKKYILDLSINSYNKKILFYEWNDIRILNAINFCQNNKIANCYLLGDPDLINKKIKYNNINFNKNINIINSNIRYSYIDKLINIRKEKGINYDNAKILLNDDMILSTMILNDNLVDGIVAGSMHNTSEIIRPALQIIKTKNINSIVSSLFIILLRNNILIYSDCAMNINPSNEDLFNISINAYNFAKKINFIPKIAMLSYYTYNKKFNEKNNILDVVNKVRNYNSNIIIDGPIQYDAAISKNVSLIKCPKSLLNGDSNVFIFPDLNSGNISYKAVQRSTNSIAIGPILQGLKKPVNDLSRGSSIDDIIYTTALTVIQSN